MTLSDLADIAEIVGGIAVVVSLIYLAVQVRQNTKSIRNSTLQANTALWSSVLVSLSEPELVKAYAVGMSGKTDIKPMQYTQFFLICRCLFVAFENQYYQYTQGALDRETYRGYERSMSYQLLSFAGFRVWWQQSRDAFSPAFVDHVDQLIEKAPLLRPDDYFREWQSLPRDELTSV